MKINIDIHKAFRAVAFIVVLMPIFALLGSCEAEFSPNDKWRDIPVVYCVLDQDEDTTFVRLQHCYLAEGDNRQYTSLRDSIYYPEGSVQVIIEEWKTWKDNSGNYHRYGDAPNHIYSFNYGEFNNKVDGEFYNEAQPLYWCETGGLLDTSCIYCLKVIRTSSGDTIAKAETMLIAGEMELLKPNNLTKFQFAGSAGSKYCEINWSGLSRARQYQPIIRFNYRDFRIDTENGWDTVVAYHYIDIPCNVVKSNMRDRYFNTRLDQSHFLDVIKTTLEGDTSNKNILDTVNIYIYCCTEDLAAYIYAGNPGNSLNQDPFIYSNVEGGLGIFAARRRHISFNVCTPVSSASQYVKSIKALNVGF